MIKIKSIRKIKVQTMRRFGNADYPDNFKISVVKRGLVFYNGGGFRKMNRELCYEIG
jgi:hypothetical protein